MAKDDAAMLAATEMVARFQDRSLSPVEAAEAALARIERLNPSLNACRFRQLRITWGWRPVCGSERGQHPWRHIIRSLHFDGAPDLLTRTRALFETTSRLKVRYPTPDPERHKLRGDDTQKSRAASTWTALTPPASITDIVWG